MSQASRFVEEKKRQTPAAALSAAQAGAKTALIEMHGQLGGVWTSGALSWVIDAKGKGGLMRALIRRRLLVF